MKDSDKDLLHAAKVKVLCKLERRDRRGEMVKNSKFFTTGNDQKLNEGVRSVPRSAPWVYYKSREVQILTTCKMEVRM